MTGVGWARIANTVLQQLGHSPRGAVPLTVRRRRRQRHFEIEVARPVGRDHLRERQIGPGTGAIEQYERTRVGNFAGMTDHREQCFAIAMPRMAGTSAAGSRRWGSRKSSRATLTLAERLRRAPDRLDSPRVFGLHRDLQRAPSAPRPVLIRRLLPTHPHASFARQGLPRLPLDHVTQDRKADRHTSGRRPALPLRTSRRLIRIRFLFIHRCVTASMPSAYILCIGDFGSRSWADRFAALIAGRLT